MQASLLIELLTEELPPKSLARLGEAFARGIRQGLIDELLVAPEAKWNWFATPRRLAIVIEEVESQQAPSLVGDKIMPVAVAYDEENKATAALLKKLRAMGIPEANIPEFERRFEGKTELLFFPPTGTGFALEQILPDVVSESINKLPIPKLMRWGDTDHQFVRPVHGLIMLHGENILPREGWVTKEVLSLPCSRITRGHRFLSGGEISITSAACYEETLLTDGKVIASFEKRRSKIDEQLKAKARALNACVNPAEELLDEVTALVEWPVVYVGEFEAEYLAVPQECLILTMQKNQKYFPLLGTDGKLLNKFLIVSNMQVNDPEHIIGGNQRVVRARLADARFFYNQDRKQPLESRVAKLGNVVYHNKLGSQLQRVQRIQKLAVEIAERLKEIKFAADIKYVERAAYLCKADLLTGMVGEFPELQGIMGYYYALHDGEHAEVAEAIREHYERVPKSAVGVCVGLADRLETLVGIYGIGLVPTGEKDPFALRRHALSVVRTLAENKLALNLMQLLEIAEAQFPVSVIAANTVPKLYDFMLERLKPYLREHGFGPDEIDAVLSLRPTRMDWIIPRLKAIQEFRKLPEAEALAAANKRIRNILRQAKGEAREVIDHTLLKEEAEKNLAQQVELLEGKVTPMLHREEYTQALKQLASLRPAVDMFFDKVMVMVEDKALRDNRLALLTKLEALFMRVADISRLQYGERQS